MHYKLMRTMKRHALRTLLSLAILIFFVIHASKFHQWEFITALERQAYDARLEITMPQTPDPRIVIVDLDEKSLSEIGRWPWNRSIMAHLIKQLFDKYKIDVLGMDVVFAEPDESSGLKKLQQLAQGPLADTPAFLERLTELRPMLDYDALFAQSLQDRRVVLGYVFTSAQHGMENIEAGALPPPTVLAEEARKIYGFKSFMGKGYAANLPQFQANAIAAGHFNSVPDPDGIVRSVPMLYGYKNDLYESLSLAVTRVALGAPHVELGLNINQGYPKLENLFIQDHQIPIDKKLRAYVPYRGEQGSFPYVSATDVWHGRLEQPEILKNKIVLLGTTAQGLLDLRATPISEIYPGVEIHANLISGMLDNKIMYNLPYEHAVEVILLLVIGLIIMIILPLLSPPAAALATFGLLGVLTGFNIIIWNDEHIVFPIATTTLLVLSLFVFNMSYGYFVESRGKRQLTSLFGQYVPPELVDEMSKSLSLGSEFSMEGESREMTVLFSDVRGFTTISEDLEPKELSELMNQYLTPMTRIIHENRGTIDKYIGDAIMAFWGAPLYDPQHARHALDASMQMLQHLEKMQPQFKIHGWPEIKIGIGLNSGYMSVGNMGSEFRMAYTVLGDAVNLGSRLEGLTKKYGVSIIVSEITKEAVSEYLYRELDRVRVKGKDQPVAIFEPVGLRVKVDKETLNELDDYDRALESYRQQNWNAARERFAKLQRRSPERLVYQIYADRIRYFMHHEPGEDWDGVYTFTTK